MPLAAGGPLNTGMKQRVFIRNTFSQLQFLDHWMEAFRQRKWDLVESSLRSLIGSFENCSKASKKSPVPAYFVTNKIPPSFVREIVLTRIQQMPEKSWTSLF